MVFAVLPAKLSSEEFSQHEDKAAKILGGPVFPQQKPIDGGSQRMIAWSRQATQTEGT